jgi:hypothetical protein
VNNCKVYWSRFDWVAYFNLPWILDALWCSAIMPASVLKNQTRFNPVWHKHMYIAHGFTESFPMSRESYLALPPVKHGLHQALGLSMYHSPKVHSCIICLLRLYHLHVVHHNKTFARQTRHIDVPLNLSYKYFQIICFHL